MQLMRAIASTCTARYEYAGLFLLHWRPLSIVYTHAELN